MTEGTWDRGKRWLELLPGSPNFLATIAMLTLVGTVVMFVNLAPKGKPVAQDDVSKPIPPENPAKTEEHDIVEPSLDDEPKKIDQIVLPPEEQIIEPPRMVDDRATMAQVARENQLAAVQRQLLHAEARLRELEAITHQWPAIVDEILNGSTGKRISGDESLVRSLQDAVKTSPTSDIDIRFFEGQLRELQQRVATESQLQLLLGNIKGFQDEIQKEVEKWSKAETNVNLIMEEASDATLSALTVNEAIDAIRARELEEERRLREEKRAAGRAKRLAELEEIFREQGESEIEDKVQAEQLARQQEELRRILERRKQEVRKSDVLPLLAPLTAADYAQPRQIMGFGAQAELTPVKGPVSLTRIRSLGTLNPNQSGMQKLALLNSSRWTTRPRWNMGYEGGDIGVWKRDHIEMVAKVQSFLREYGDVLVEMELLAP